MRRIVRPGERERGAVAVVMAIWMVVLIGFGAVAIDLAGAYSERQQLQNGADAGALAIANSCMNGACVDSADTYAKANKLDGQATGTVVGSLTSPVTVKASHTRTNWFGGVLGIPTTDLSATAKAEWGAISGGSTFPITFSWCQFYTATGGWDYTGTALKTTEVKLFFKDNGNTGTGCTHTAHGAIPGGFGFLDAVDCKTTIKTGNWVGSDTGYDGPNSCDDDDWATLNGSTILIPIYRSTQGTGNNGEYLVEGLAAFKITGFYIKNKSGYNANWTDKPNKGIKGYFSTYTDVSGGYTIASAATNFGARGMRLSA